MKTCLCCSSVVEANAPTCPNCGEGSFDGSSAIALPKSVPTSVPVTADSLLDPGVAGAPKSGQRGGRRNG